MAQGASSSARVRSRASAIAGFLALALGVLLVALREGVLGDGRFGWASRLASAEQDQWLAIAVALLAGTAALLWELRASSVERFLAVLRGVLAAIGLGTAGFLSTCALQGAIGARGPLFAAFENLALLFGGSCILLLVVALVALSRDLAGQSRWHATWPSLAIWSLGASSLYCLGLPFALST